MYQMDPACSRKKEKKKNEQRVRVNQLERDVGDERKAQSITVVYISTAGNPGATLSLVIGTEST